MKIMIHACPARLWYVNEHLIPLLRAQGLEDITLWLDSERRGNLRACAESFASLRGEGDTWHLQDDVLPCRDFARRAAALEGTPGLICGFVNEHGGPDARLCGAVSVPAMWFSFPCIRIPDEISRTFAGWLDGEGRRYSKIRQLLASGKGDDAAFRIFMETEHEDAAVLNLTPCLVQHVDYLLGGSQCSPWRGFYTPAAYWEDADAERELKESLQACL